MIEVLFTSGLDDNQTSCSVWDYRTGTNLMTYKGGGNLQQHSLCLIRSEYVIAGNSCKPLLHVWPINAQEQISQIRFVVPGVVNALVVSPDGFFIVAAIQETIYIWQLTTGRMLNMISKHYQTINCLYFTDDGSHFASGGQDGTILIWNLTQVVSQGVDNQTPLYSFTDHGLGVTDMFVGAGGLSAYLYTTSLDRTCKVYDLKSGTLLLSVVFVEALHSIIANSLETCVYVGTNIGNIFEFYIDSIPRSKEYHITDNHTNKFEGHMPNTSVNCLALSLDGQTLVSGGQDKQVCVWHIPSRQLLKIILNKGVLKNIKLHLTNTSTFDPEHKQRNIFSGNLRRMIEPPNADDDEVIEVYVTEQNAQDEDTETQQSKDHDEINYIPSSFKENSSDKIKELSAEIQRLKKINKELFQISAQNILKRQKKE